MSIHVRCIYLIMLFNKESLLLCYLIRKVCFSLRYLFFNIDWWTLHYPRHHKGNKLLWIIAQFARSDCTFLETGELLGVWKKLYIRNTALNNFLCFGEVSDSSGKWNKMKTCLCWLWKNPWELISRLKMMAFLTIDHAHVQVTLCSFGRNLVTPELKRHIFFPKHLPEPYWQY